MRGDREYGYRGARDDAWGDRWTRDLRDEWDRRDDEMRRRGSGMRDERDFEARGGLDAWGESDRGLRDDDRLRERGYEMRAPWPDPDAAYRVRDDLRSVGERMGRGVERVGEGAYRMGADVARASDELGDRMGDRAYRMGTDMARASDELTGRLGERAYRMGEDLERGAERISERAERVAERAGDRAHRIRDRFVHAFDRMRGPFTGRGPKGYRRRDERIREDVCDQIANQGWVDASDVEVKVDHGEVTLRGTVRDRADKRRLECMLDQIPGVVDVQNELKVGRRETLQLGPGAPSTAVVRGRAR